jgi:type III pantothenate kinase
MNLIIDIGNTLTKLAVFEKNRMVGLTDFKSGSTFDFNKYLAEYQEINHCIVSSVSTDEDSIIHILNAKKIHTVKLHENTPLPFINKYKTPSTLGKDRLASIAGAYKLYPKQR